MNWVRKVFFGLLISTFFLAGCSKQKQGALSRWMQDNGKIKVLSTISQIGDLVSEIGGDRVDSWVLIQGELDPHSYELVKGDGEKFERASLIFYNGLGLEHGASLSSLLDESPHSIALGEKVLAHFPERILKRANALDPHIWMDVSIWQQVASSIVEELSQIDPEGREFYEARGEILQEKMLQTHRKISQELRSLPSERRFLVTSHDAFHYFTRAYLADEGESNWRRRVAAPEGLAPDGQISSLEIRKTLEFIQEHRVFMVFPESNVSQDSIRKIAQVAQKAGLSLRVCERSLYGDSMGGLRYLDMMEHNARVLAEHLRESP